MHCIVYIYTHKIYIHQKIEILSKTHKKAAQMNKSVHNYDAQDANGSGANNTFGFNANIRRWPINLYLKTVVKTIQQFLRWLSFDTESTKIIGSRDRSGAVITEVPLNNRSKSASCIIQLYRHAWTELHKAVVSKCFINDLCMDTAYNAALHYLLLRFC